MAGHTIHSQRLDNFTESVLKHHGTLPGSLWALISFNWRGRLLYIKLSYDLHKNLMILAKRDKWVYSTFTRQKRQAKQQLREYIFMLRKVALFRVYVRFFFFWRNAHVPLSYLLLMSGVLHVIAVHMY